MSGRGFLLLALLLLVTVEATKVEKNKPGVLDIPVKSNSDDDSIFRYGRRDMQSPLLSERLRF
uniref:Conorfamide-Tx1 n=1 Tax=Conus textile TaxID=6494 RepID=CRFA1_CONTE|nr:RecName: Full=Conorfamide-Tx1; Short=CNF-Tx1; AltName: Full=Cono-RFamide-Tx1; Flags: Precursor [Conus textile]